MEANKEDKALAQIAIEPPLSVYALANFEPANAFGLADTRFNPRPSYFRTGAA